MSDEVKGAAASKYSEILAPLREKYDGRIAAFPLGKHGLFVIRYPTGLEARMHGKKMRYARKMGVEQGADAEAELTEFEAVEFLLLLCQLPTDKAAARAALEDFWGVIPTMMSAANRLAGGDVSDVGKD